MSDDNKNLRDNLDDMMDDAKKGTRKAAEKAEEFAGEAKESAKEFAQEAKETFNKATGDNKKILAGILAIVVGGFGVHKFILGYNKEGIIMLVVTIALMIFTCAILGWVMSLVGLIEGIIYLTKSDEEFYNTYQVGKKPWF